MDSISSNVNSKRVAATKEDYDAILSGPYGQRFFNAIISNSPRNWQSRAGNGSYCEELHMNLSVAYEQTSCRYIEYSTWVKLANMTGTGASIKPDPKLSSTVFDTKEIKRCPVHIEKESEPVRSPCNNINCNCATHMFEPALPPMHRRKPWKVALFAVTVTVVLVVVITVPIVMTHRSRNNDGENWTNPHY